MTIIYLIPAIILVGSFVGISVVLFKKIPVLTEIEESSSESSESWQSKIKNIVQKIIQYFPGAEKFKYELYLQKTLSKIRILTLKTESQTGLWLEKLRQKANQKNGLSQDNNYWQKLKKAKKEK